MSEWISVEDRLPEKNKPFLALTTWQIEMMDWKEKVIDGENKGWFGFYCPCCCCNGNCTDHFKYWMPLPNPPENL